MKPTLSLWIALAAILIIPVCLMAQSSSNVFTIQRSAADGLNLHFELPAWTMDDVTRGGESLRRVNVANTPYLFIDEEETLPIFTASVAIPYTGGADLQVLGSSNQALPDVRMDFDAALTREKESGRLQDQLYPSNTVMISEPMILRDFRIVTINVYPFQYDQQTRQLHVNESIDIRISFNSAPSVNEMLPPQKYSSSFKDIYRSIILNYNEVSPRDADYSSPVLLVMYGNYSDTSFQTRLTQYINWKRQMGFTVFSSSVATGSTSATVKSYIQNAYDTWTDKPDYVVLIGDVSGTIAVPTESNYNDYLYSQVAGNDVLGDLFIGRISVTNTDEFLAYTSKLFYYERDIVPSTATWLNKMLLVGDTSSSGISTIYTNRYIRDLSSATNPSYTYTEMYGDYPSDVTVNSNLTQGVGFFNYRGWIGMSNWDTTDIANIYNNNRPYNAVIITCDTGSFGSGTSRTEAIIRTGSDSQVRGGVTAIGMATSSTHTPLNNCLDMAIFHGLFSHDMRDMGNALLYSKIYLNSVYQNSGSTQYDQSIFFAKICNLMGDPTAIVYRGIPGQLSVSVPTSIPSGSNSIGVTVLDSNSQPVPNAVVTVTNSSGLFVSDITNPEGQIAPEFPHNTTGTLTITARKDGYRAAVGTSSIVANTGFVYSSSFADDGYGGISQGNGDGYVNGSETIEYWLSVQNNTSISSDITIVATCSSPYITIIDNRMEYDVVASGQIAESTTPLQFSVDADCPDGYSAIFTMTDVSGAGLCNFPVNVLIRNGDPVIQSFAFTGAPGNLIYPGDQYPMTFTISNDGLGDMVGINGTLRSFDPYCTVSDSLGVFGNITVGATSTNVSDSFTLTILGQGIEGMVIPMELRLNNSQGYQKVLPFTITVGSVTLNDPLGQDAYGYFIFDMDDTGYMLAPTYEWIGIAPAEGGSGSALTLTDPGVSGDEGDQTNVTSITTVNLPFTFKFYGVDYSQASISSNGFIAFGSTQNSDWRNWHLPGAGGPNPMIAAFWDDLCLNTGAVYTYYNSAQHYYVVEWYNLTHGKDLSTQEAFQAILYDPTYYPTFSGDGQIKLQYKVFNNIDTSVQAYPYPYGNYCTIGIKDHTGTIGLEYSYNNSYPTAASPLANNSALFISTMPIPQNAPYITLGSILINDPTGNNNGLLDTGETAGLGIRLVNHGLISANNVQATLTSSDPYLTIVSNASSYGTIAGGGSAAPQTPFQVQVSPTVPDGHQASCSLSITSASGSWIRDFHLLLNAPAFSFGSISISDPSGNANGVLDPGETVVVSIPLINSGGAASMAGTCQLSTTTPGITIINGTASFTSVQASGSTALSFTVSASSALSNGTLASLSFQASAGNYSASHSHSLEIGAPLLVSIGSGTAAQSYPIDRYYNYSVHEAIYLASEIGTSCTIKSLGFYKASGTDINPIQSVSIYMKHTTATSLATGNYSTTGYTLVFSGDFPNTATTGWMEVNLDDMFAYNSEQNLSILVVKNFQQYVNNYPQWAYTAVNPARARQNRSDSAMPTSLTASANLPNLHLRVFPVQEVLYPPQELTASTTNLRVDLTWSAPVSGTPVSYKVYRNSSLLATVSGLTYTDLAVVNGTTYSYTVSALYSEGESDPSGSVDATPNAIAPTNLTAIPGNGNVALSWTAATGRALLDAYGERERTISSYKVYRNGTALTTVTGTTYQDTAVTNGTSYTYYVTTVYTDPAGESGPSNSVDAMPSTIDFVVIGNGSSVTSGGQNSPINISNNSVHGQLIYTAAELNTAGVTGPIQITGLGFYVNSAPALPLPNFLVRMKHTTATNGANWQTADGLLTTYSNASYTPTAGGWDMLMFSTPFEWNGTDNILVDTAFGLVATASNSGTLQYTSTTSGYRFAWNNFTDQTNVFTGGTLVNRRYNIRFALQDIPAEPEIAVSPTSIPFGNITVNATSSQQFTIENSGGQDLTGTITTPTGYTVALAARDGGFATNSGAEARNVLNISVPGGETLAYTLTFAPTTAAAYNGNVVIATNDSDEATVNLAVTGTGTAAYATVNPTSIPFGNVTVNSTSNQTFTIQNTGNITLTGNITTPTGYTVALAARDGDNDQALGTEDSEGRNTLTISVTAGQTRTYQLTFAPTATGSYNGNVVVSTNSLTNPTVNIAVTGTGTAAYATVNPTAIPFGVVDVNGTAIQQFTIQNTGNITLTGSVATPTGYSVALSTREGSQIGQGEGERNTLSISVPAGQTRSYQLTFAPTAAGEYNGNVVVSTNSLTNPTINISVSGTGYQNHAPAINLPVSLSFDENGTLQVDMDPFTSDQDSDPLTLTASGNSQISVQISGLNVTFGAAANWYGSETITFTVSDGELQASDTVLVTVNHVVNWLAAPVAEISDGSTGCVITWSPVPDATAYLVYRSSSPDGGFTQIAQTSQTQYTDTAALDAAFYMVKAINTPPAK